MEWNSVLYDQKHDYVSAYGQELLSYIPHNPAQKILDVGCGTGTLTAQLADVCSYVLGIDSSPAMIERAARQHKQIDFKVCDALALPFESQWDVVFSNAVFHWIADHNRLLQTIHRALKPQGLLVCEFGASGNIAAIESAFSTALQECGSAYQPKFNFPTVEQFTDRLIKNRFIIEEIFDYNRPTPLKGGEQGLANWMRQFFASELSMLSEK